MESTVKESSNLIPILRVGVTMTTIGDETIIYPNHDDESTEPYVIWVNETGSLALSMVDGNTSICDITKKICLEYDIDNELFVTKDIIELFKELEEKRIIEWKQ